MTTREQLAQELGRWARRLRDHAGAHELGLGVDPDSYAQTVCYALFVARIVTRDADVELTRTRAPSLLPATGPATRELLRRCIAGEWPNAITRTIDAITRLLSRVDIHALFADVDDPAIHFYEQFLDAYDPAIRRRMGVYYTPAEVVEAMVGEVDGLLRSRLGLELGLADPIRWGEYAARRGVAVPAGVGEDEFVVQILDPASGTGAFLLRVVERIHATMTAEYEARELSPADADAAWRSYVREALLPRLSGFELMLAPYVVAHLRLALALEQRGFRFTERDHLGVCWTNTLALGDETDELKLARPISVVLGNPPYERISTATDESAAWILSGTVPGRADGKSLFDDIRDVAREHTIFSHLRSLPDRYVYFWRWAVWKAFEQREGPGVVALISNSTWLTGPGFVGLRKLAREQCDEIRTIDLGGDGGGTRPEPNVFGVGTPVAITTLVRVGMTADGSPARGDYRKVEGEAREQKLAGLAALDERGWTAAPSGWLAPLVPATGDATWRSYPALADLFPWQQPGCLASRTWPIAPDPATLRARWSRFVGAPADQRPRLFATAKTGRNVHTRVPGYATLASLDADAEPEPIVRYCLRSFDRQWILADPRLLKTESPALWRSASRRQVYLCSLMSVAIGPGPALTVAAHVPDFHHFRGSYGGKDVLPLYRDADAREPNVTHGLLARLAALLSIPEPRPEQLAAYVYALLSTPDYPRRFADALATPGPRVPLTRDAELWARAVALGERLLWLHTYAERFRDPSVGRETSLPSVAGLAWIVPVAHMPKRLGDVGYDPATRILAVGDGRVAGVREDAWNYTISGMQVIKRWLAYRTASGAGRAMNSANPLDRIRPGAWVDAWSRELIELIAVLTHTLDLQPEQTTLLAAIAEGPTISASELPAPSAAERRPPRRGATSDS